jgi:hypothetical protein
MHDHNDGHKKNSVTASILGSGTSGLLELIIFHPFDTIIKRLMSNETKSSQLSSPERLNFYSKIVFKEQHDKNFFKKINSLYFGFSYAVSYKVLQRVYKFGFQPVVKDVVDTHLGSTFVDTFGKKHSSWLMHAFGKIN